MSYLKIDYDVEVTKDYRDYSEDFGFWEENKIFTLNSQFRIVERNEFYHISTDIEVKKGVPYYLVYAVYETGDSFGRSTGNHEFIAFLESQEEARELLDILRDNRDDKYSVEFKGNTYYRPWLGYFDRLEDLTYGTIYLTDEEF